MLGTILFVKLNWATNSQVIIHQVILGLEKAIEGSPVPVVLELELTAESSGGLDETQMGFWFGGCGVHLRIAFLTGGVEAVGLETIDLIHSLYFTGAAVWWMWAITGYSGTLVYTQMEAEPLHLKWLFQFSLSFFFFLLVLATASSFIFSSVMLFGGLGVGRRV